MSGQERFSEIGHADGDVGKLFRGRPGNDRAVAAGEDEIVAQRRMREQRHAGRRHLGEARLQSEHLERRAGEIGRRIMHARGDAVDVPVPMQHAREVDRIVHEFANLLRRQLFLGAAFGVQAAIRIEFVAVVGIDDLDAVDVEAVLLRQFGDDSPRAGQDDFDPASVSDDARRFQESGVRLRVGNGDAALFRGGVVDDRLNVRMIHGAMSVSNFA